MKHAFNPRRQRQAGLSELPEGDVETLSQKARENKQKQDVL